MTTPDGPIWALLLAAVATWAWAAWQVRQGRPPLAYEGRRPVPWAGRDVAIIFASLPLAMSLSQTLLFHLYGAQPAADGKIPDEVLATMFAGVSISELCTMVLVIGLLIWRRGATWADLGFDVRRFGRDLAAGLIGFLLIIAPIMLLYAILIRLFKSNKLHPLIELARRQPSQLWLIGFCAVLVAPLVEEFFFRVILQGWLERRERSIAREARLWPALPTGMVPILISSLLFAAVHAGQWPAPVPLFFLALVLGYLYHQTHRLLPSLVVHALLNGCTFLNLWWMIHGEAVAK
jgi:membrane protease YdiL (CAAX protease family)